MAALPEADPSRRAHHASRGSNRYSPPHFLLQAGPTTSSVRLRRARLVDGGSPIGMMLNAGTDCRKDACIVQPVLTSADESRIAQARNLRHQLETLTRPSQKEDVKQKR
jgi:hypothetical protein